MAIKENMIKQSTNGKVNSLIRKTQKNEIWFFEKYLPVIVKTFFSIFLDNARNVITYLVALAEKK